MVNCTFVHITLSLTIVLTLAGCTQGGTEEVPDLEDGKADVFMEPDLCSLTSLIDDARSQLIQAEPDFYTRDGFVDESSYVDRIEDLNDDRVGDIIVSPGWQYAGSNSEYAVYLTDEDGCATIFVGHFGASSVTPAFDDAVTNGVGDLFVSNTSACRYEVYRYTFDGVRYIEAGLEDAENLCESDCLSDEELVVEARAQLIQDEPDFYSSDLFHDGFVDRFVDLNGDGVDDVLLFPGLSYGGANVEQAVYLTDEKGCATVYAGHFGASSVMPTEDRAVTNGVRDLSVTNASGCEAVDTRFTFDGLRYVEGAYEIVNLCD